MQPHSLLQKVAGGGTPMERIRLLLKKNHSLGTSTEYKENKKPLVTYSIKQGYNDFNLE